MLVDFSSKHDILIHHKDGSYTPMDEPYYEVTKLYEDTWQIMSSGDYHYLVVGDEFGVAIDTGYGAGNLRKFLEKLCGKPVPWVINTHHHFDHSANNCYFDKAFMAAEAVDMVSVPYESFKGMDFFENSYEKQVVTTGDVISVPGRELIIFRIGEHTEDGIAILDKKRRILFSGDEFMPNMKNYNGRVQAWKEKLDALIPYRNDFDTLCGGPEILPAEEFDIFYEAAKQILAGEISSEAAPKGGHPPGEQPTYNGHRVYDCQMPHIEDIPKGGFGDDGKEAFVYKGHVFRYVN